MHARAAIESILQEIILGEKTLIGNGNIRDVYLAEYKGQQLVVKVLRDDFEERASKTRVDNIHRWEAAAIDAVRNDSVPPNKNVCFHAVGFWRWLFRRGILGEWG